MISLKAFAPVLAETFCTTPAAVYERQRALVRQGLLPAPVGRGRGNGLPATAETVAMIIIAIMVTDNLSDTDERVRRLAGVRFRGNWQGELPAQPRCALTGKRDFKSALTALLTMTDFPDRVHVWVSRNYMASRIAWKKGRVDTVSQFGAWPHVEKYEVEAHLFEGAIKTIRNSLQQASDDRELARAPRGLATRATNWTT
jgi:hypothetical protein